MYELSRRVATITKLATMTRLATFTRRATIYQTGDDTNALYRLARERAAIRECDSNADARFLPDVFRRLPSAPLSGQSAKYATQPLSRNATALQIALDEGWMD